MVILRGEDGFAAIDGDATQMYAIVAVRNYDEMVGALGGDASELVTTLSLGDEDVYASNLGGGFCALAPDASLLKGAGTARGMLGAHEAFLGEIGRRVVGENDVSVALNISAFRPAIESGFGEMRSTMDDMAMMMGDQGAGIEQFIRGLNGLEQMLLDDGRAAVLGLDVDEHGFSIDAGVQFSEDSQAAELASSPGHAKAMLDRVPDVPIIFAFSMDMSSPAMKEWIADLVSGASDMGPDKAMFGMMNVSDLMDQQDGSAFIMGDSPSLMMGGMFQNMLEFKSTKDSKNFIGETRQLVQKMDGMSQGGITFNTTLDAGAKTIEGVKVDAWSMRMTPDPENPAAGQMAMVFPMIFGPNMGPQGYYAAVDGGLITTMGQNDALMAKAIASARGGGGLSSNEKMRRAMSHQPEDAVATVFIDYGRLGKQVMNMAAMMGQQAPFEIPEEMDLIGMSIATSGGGVQGRIHVPQDLLDLATKFTALQNENDRNGGGPRF